MILLGLHKGYSRNIVGHWTSTATNLRKVKISRESLENRSISTKLFFKKTFTMHFTKFTEKNLTEKKLHHKCFSTTFVKVFKITIL